MTSEIDAYQISYVIFYNDVLFCQKLSIYIKKIHIT